MNPVLIAFTILLCLKLAAEVLLDYLNLRNIQANANTIPDGFRGFIDTETYEKSVAYSIAKQRFSIVDSLFDTAFLAVLVFSGVLVWLWAKISELTGTGLWGQSIGLFLLGILLSLPGLPLELYNTFKLEARFGFNKSTAGLWISDKLKGLVLSTVLLIPLLTLILWLVNLPVWWVWAAIVITVFQIVMLVAYPMFIMPLFNKFTDLEAGDLRDRLMSLAERTGFQARSILVMDGSKRSGHSNAFFSGLGKMRRIVLFDTLMNQLTEEELEAILAHEIGHYKLSHIPRLLLVNVVITIAAFAVLGWLLQQPNFIQAFGFQWQPGLYAPTFLMFSMISGLVTFWITPFSSIFSRRYEYQADAFAKKALQGDGQPLICALHKLHKENLSNLTPHPLYSAFHYSHPTLTERETALRED
ncbi:MAG: M48 family metallopeptidase [Opitutales bacterium]|nr:M48 family metallopeptidase [Opitutales bacterium]